MQEHLLPRAVTCTKGICKLLIRVSDNLSSGVILLPLQRHDESVTDHEKDLAR